MRKFLDYGRLAAVCGLFVIFAALFTGCGKKYEKITLPELTQAETDQGTTEGSRADTDPQGAAKSVTEEDGAAPLPILYLTDESEEAAQADGQAVAGTIPLDSDLTTASGFTDVDETVYVMEDLVNIRSGCGTEYTILTQLNKGDSLKRTGISEGWSRVVYKDKTCYVLSDYISTADPSGESGGGESVKMQGTDVMAASETPGGEAVAQAVSNGRIVAIDAGHQAKGNSEKEPVGPGSSTMKAKVAAGTEGVSTKIPEYKLTLEVSERLKRMLEERGYKVVMIRESNDVNISNAERAEIANKSGASVFVRIHANSLDNSSVRGTLAMCQTSKNPYNGELHDQSYLLSKRITDGVCSATGFKNRGVQETDTMSGINWSQIPVSIVEMGFMSNPEEDQLMAQEEYQEKIAAGIAAGIDAYFGG